jgi:hypothetical protein
MIHFMIGKRIIAVSVVSALLVPLVWAAEAQIVPGTDFTAAIDRDLRVFTVVAALNVAGFDVELASQYHPVRQAVRQQLGALDPDLTSRLSEFYEAYLGDTAPEDELARYISLALNLTDPPEMVLTSQDLFLPPDVRGLEEFVPLLNEFYVEAEIGRMWVQLAPVYDDILDLMAGPLRETVNQTNAYLREPPVSGRARGLVAFVELAAPINSVQVRNYPDSMYLVLGFSPSVPVEEVRHAYLHLVLDDIIARSREELTEKEAISDWIRNVEGVRSDYADDFEILVAESLIRAVELRMDGDSDNVRGEVDEAYRSGSLLAPYFMSQMSDFEQSVSGIRAYFPEMVLNLDVGQERARFDDRFYTIELPAEDTRRAQVPVAPVTDPIRDLLTEAQEAFNRGDDDVARESFETVLYQLDSGNGSALYGLALIASREADPDLARDFFVQTVESDSAELWMRAWSHVYMGRIYDAVDCNREAAVAEYGLALALEDDANGAQAAAELGLGQAFGGGC